MSTDRDWIRSDGKDGIRIGDADPVTADQLDAFVSLIYRVAGRRPAPLDAARITTYFKDATEEEVCTFLDRFEMRDRFAEDSVPADVETCRAGAYQAGGDEL